jgi:hypothetical protein
MADRSNFWKIVDRTKPNKLRAFADSELRDCQNYFSEVQSDSTLPPNEIITASERLALLRSELDRRHSDAEHRQTQRLARWAIGVGVLSLAVAIVIGISQILASRSARENWPTAVGTSTVATPAAIETPTVATPTPSASPSPAEKAELSSPAASPTASPKAKPTSKKAKTKRKARPAASPMRARAHD